jgi:oligoendopeptidase F
MPIYKVPDVFEVALDDLELPSDVPVDANMNEKPLAECTQIEVAAAVRAFSGLLRQSQSEIEASIVKHNEIRRRVAHLQAYNENFETIDWVRETGT